MHCEERSGNSARAETDREVADIKPWEILHVQTRTRNNVTCTREGCCGRTCAGSTVSMLDIAAPREQKWKGKGTDLKLILTGLLILLLIIEGSAI